jgi:hypothetical protein
MAMASLPGTVSAAPAERDLAGAGFPSPRPFAALRVGRGDSVAPRRHVGRFNGLIPTVIDTNLSARHGRAPSRPSTSLILQRFQDVDARDKRGHDESMAGAAGIIWLRSPVVEAL